jgi:hypothetical protein
VASSLAVCSPSASSWHRVATDPGGNQPPSTCPLSVSHALRAFLRPVPAGLVSCRSRPWGSTLQGRDPLAEQYVLSDADALVRLTDHMHTVSTALAAPGSWGCPERPRPSGEETALTRSAPLQGVAPCERPYLRGQLFKPTRRPRPSWVSSSLGNSPSPSATRPGVHPLTSLAPGAQARPEAAPQSFRPAKKLAGLPRACHPFRGLPPCRHSPIFTEQATRGCPSETAPCYQEAGSLLRVVSSAAGAPGECRFGDGALTKRPELFHRLAAFTKRILERGAMNP